MKIILTGAAGFIGFHATQKLAGEGHEIIGIDNLNDYYDVALKNARLAELQKITNFTFIKADVSSSSLVEEISTAHPDAEIVLHLAAQAGVRYSLINPYQYIDANVKGQTVIMELCRKLPNFKKLVYASSSSVYGANKKIPFSESDRVDSPISLYAASKRAAEMVVESYHNLYKIPAIGLRFFTVYGAWGRPDMSPWIFTDSILSGKPLNLFNHGNSRRDFTYVGDVVDGIAAAIKFEVGSSKFEENTSHFAPRASHLIYNLGNDKPIIVSDFVALIEKLCGKKANINMMPAQPGDVDETWADITLARNELAYNPQTGIEAGMQRFVEWFRGYSRL